MNHHETSWLQRIIFLITLILVVVSSVISVKPVFAQVAPANFDAVDDYIRTKMQELGIPGAALVIDVAGVALVIEAAGVALATPGFVCDVESVTTLLEEPQPESAMDRARTEKSPKAGRKMRETTSSLPHNQDAIEMIQGRLKVRRSRASRGPDRGRACSRR